MCCPRTMLDLRSRVEGSRCAWLGFLRPRNSKQAGEKRPRIHANAKVFTIVLYREVQTAELDCNINSELIKIYTTSIICGLSFVQIGIDLYE
jgi:hypothetical protein